MFELFRKKIMTSMLIILAAVTLTGCGKNGSSAESSERKCHHLEKEKAPEAAPKKAQEAAPRKAPEAAPRKAQEKVIKIKKKAPKKNKCEKCARHKCICHDNHEEYDEMMEYRAFEHK